MTTIELDDILKSLEIPYTEHHFSKPQDMPFIVWTDEGSDNIAADNRIWFERTEFEIAIYSHQKHRELKEKLEKAFNHYGVVWNRESTQWDDKEKFYWTVYHVS